MIDGTPAPNPIYGYQLLILRPDLPHRLHEATCRGPIDPPGPAKFYRVVWCLSLIIIRSSAPGRSGPSGGGSDGQGRVGVGAAAGSEGGHVPALPRSSRQGLHCIRHSHFWGAVHAFMQRSFEHCRCCTAGPLHCCP